MSAPPLRFRRHFAAPAPAMVPVMALVMALAVVTAATLAPSPALSHKVRVFAYSDTETIFVEAQFSKDSPAVDCGVTLTGPHGEVANACTTDHQGLCEMPVPENASGDYTVTVNAGEGHRAEWTLLESDYK